MSEQVKRLVVGLSGASGVILGIRMLEVLQEMDIESHLIISPAAKATIAEETNWKMSDVLAGNVPSAACSVPGPARRFRRGFARSNR